MMCVFNMIKPNTDICFATQMRRKLQICIYVSDMQPQSLGSVWYLAVTQSAPTCLPSAVVQTYEFLIRRKAFIKRRFAEQHQLDVWLFPSSWGLFSFFRGPIMPTQPAQRGGTRTPQSRLCMNFLQARFKPRTWLNAGLIFLSHLHPSTHITSQDRSLLTCHQTLLASVLVTNPDDGQKNTNIRKYPKPQQRMMLH